MKLNELALIGVAWGSDKLVIETGRPSTESLYIREMELGGRFGTPAEAQKEQRFWHGQLVIFLFSGTKVATHAAN